MGDRGLGQAPMDAERELGTEHAVPTNRRSEPLEQFWGDAIDDLLLFANPALKVF